MLEKSESACLLALAQTSGDSSDLPDFHGSLLSSRNERIMNEILQPKDQLSIGQKTKTRKTIDPRKTRSYTKEVKSL
jgi:hypothetical protein